MANSSPEQSLINELNQITEGLLLATDPCAMSKKSKLLVPITLFFAWQAQSQSLNLPTLENFESGQKLFQRQSSNLGYEKGIFTTVPVDYKNPASDHFEIYSWFANDFNPLTALVSSSIVRKATCMILSLFISNAANLLQIIHNAKNHICQIAVEGFL